jgi:hypothetical protein
MSMIDMLSLVPYYIDRLVRKLLALLLTKYKYRLTSTKVQIIVDMLSLVPCYLDRLVRKFA